MKKLITATFAALAISAVFTCTASASSLLESVATVTSYRTHESTREEVLMQVVEQAKGQTPPSNTVSNAPTEKVYPQQNVKPTGNSNAKSPIFSLIKR